MNEYSYTATDEAGQTQHGRIAAQTSDNAEQALRDRGLTSITLTDLGEISQPTPVVSKLNETEAEQLTVFLAELADAGLPLSDGLRAAAAESSTARLAGAMRRVAAQLDHGRPLDEILADRSFRMPDHLRGLVAAAMRSGKMGEALADLIEQDRETREVLRTVRSSLSYPVFVASLACAIFLLIGIVIVPEFLQMINDFELELPPSTRLFISMHKYGLWSCTSIAPPLIVLLFIARWLMGPANWQRIIASVPLWGGITHWSGVAEFARILAVLLKQNVPLHEALQYSAGGIRDANVAQVCQRMATRVAGGHSFADLVAESSRLPTSLVPLVRWGEQTGTLAESMQSAAEMFASRVRLRASFMRTICPPFVFIGIMAITLFVVTGLALPLRSMLYWFMW